MKRLSKTIVALFLSLLVITQIIPMSVFAENQDVDTSTYDTVHCPENIKNSQVKDSQGLTVIQKKLKFAVSTNDNKVLLLQSRNPWDTATNDTLLQQLNINYEKVAIDSATELDFSKYKMIMVADDQDNAFYSTLSKIRTKLEQYVMDGGTLLYGVCDSGWAGGTSDLLIPGDVELNSVYYSYYNYIQDSDNPIVTGKLSDGIALQNSDLYNNYCSHRSFKKDSLPADTDIILVNENKDPTLVSYPIGSGVVIASALTWEHCYAYNHGRFGEKAYDDLILYAYHNVAKSETVSGLGTVDTDNGYGCSAGEPVNVSNGNFYAQKNDLSINGSNPLTLYRTYNAMDTSVGTLGAKWRYNFEVKLSVLSDRRVRIIFEDGHTEDFIHGDDGIWFGESNKYKNIQKFDNGCFQITKSDGTSYYFNSDGTLQKIQDIAGNETDLTYESGKLVKVQNQCGYFVFQYDGEFLKSATDSSGRTVSYQIINGCLTSVTDINGNTSGYEYDSQNRMLKMIDQSNVVRLQNGYDDAGRVVKQTMADGSSCSFEYSDDSTTTTYTDRNGAKSVYTHDADNRVSNRTYVDGAEKYSFDLNNQITSYTDKNGNTYKYTYDNNGNIASETDPDGNTLTYTYNSNNKVTSITNPDGSYYVYTYDEKGNLLTAKDTLGRVLTIEYNDQSLPIKTVLPNGAYSLYTYDKNGNLLTSADPDGNTTSYSYDNLNRISAVTKPNGNTIHYDYTPSGDVQKITYSDGTTTTKTYDKRGLVTKETDESGNITSYTYNNMGEVETKTDATGNVTKYHYDSMSNVDRITNADQSEISYSYNQANKLESSTDGEGHKTSYEYDGNGNITKGTDAAGNSTLYGYDALNRLISTTNAKGAKTSYEYRYDGKLEKIVDALNGTIQYSYDSAGQLLSEQNQIGTKTNYTYNALGYVESETNSNGGVTKYQYDNGGHVIKVTNPNGGIQQMAYDADGNLIRCTNANGNITSYFYDSRDRLIKIRNAAGKDKKIEYTQTGKVSAITDENGNRTVYRYDMLDRLIGVSDAEGGKATYVYDAVGNLTEIHQFSGVSSSTISRMKKSASKSYSDTMKELITKYTYDKRGLLTKEADPTNKIKVYSYDADGNLVSKQDSDGSLTKYEYDAVKNLSKIQYSDGKTVNYEYNPLNKAISMTDWNGKSSYDLDALGRITKVKDYQGEIVQYSWNSMNEKQSITYPNGSTVNYSYDTSGNLGQVKDASGKVTSYQYDLNGNILEKILPNGVKTTYTYDNLSQLTNMNDTDSKGKLIDRYSYAYDAVGNKTLVNREKNFNPIQKVLDEGQGKTQYKYDKLNELVEVDKPNAQVEKYFYDTLGNRIRKEDSTWFGILTSSTNYKYDDGNRLTEIDGNAGTIADTVTLDKVSFSYDERGNLTKITNMNRTIGQYSYDSTGKMSSSVNALGIKSIYGYDGSGRRISRTVETPTVNIPGSKFTCTKNKISIGLKKAYTYLNDITSEYGNVLDISENDGGSQQYTYGLDVISVDSSEKTICGTKNSKDYYLQDELGSPSKLLDERGRTIASYSYNEFGVPSLTTSANAVIDDHNIFGFTSYQYDWESGLMYAQARYYSPEMGRFTAQDNYKGNINNQLSMNLYDYCYNNPVRLYDPDGKTPYVYKCGEDYEFYPDNVANNIIIASYGFIPFGGFIPEGIYKLGGYETISDDDFCQAKKGLTFTLDTLSQAEKLGDINKLPSYVKMLGKSVGKIAEIVSFAITAVDIGEQISGKEKCDINNIVDFVLGPDLVSKTKENVIIKYAYAYSKIEDLIKKGKISYNIGWFGQINDLSWYQKDIDQISDELKSIDVIMGK